MKAFQLATLAASYLYGFLSCHDGVGQITLGHSPYRQDFNAIGTGLPAGWSVRTGATSSSLGTVASFSGGASAWSSSTGAFKNFAGADGLTSASTSSVQSASANRALGLRQTGTFGDPGGAFVMNLDNTAGLTHFVLNFKLQSLDGSNTGRTVNWRVDYGFGSLPASFVSVDTSPANLATTLSSPGWGSTWVTIDFSAALDNHSEPVWIRIVTLTASSGAGSRPSVAVDDVELSYSEIDLVPPLFSPTYPKITNVTDNGFVLLTSLDEPGHTYFVVLPVGSQPPNSDQIRRGADGSGTLLPAGSFGDIATEIPLHEYQSVIAMLNPATTYDVYVVSEDSSQNLQHGPVKLTLRTESKKTEVPGQKSFSENFDSCRTVSSFTSFSVAGAQNWSCTKSGMASGGIRMNGYAGNALANEDWLISPMVRLDQNPELTFYSQFSFAGNPLQLKISVDYAGSGDPALAAWTTLPCNFPTAPVNSTSTDLSDWALSTVDLAAYSGRAVYVAWIYTSTSSTAARWTLDSIRFVNASAGFMLTSVSELSFKSPGIIKSYTVEGFNLANELIITAPESFEISNNNQEFGPQIRTSASSAVTVYVRFKPGLPVGDHTGYVLNESDGTASKRILVRGADVSLTFDLTTYNLEFFGTDVKNESGTEYGPANDALQVRNVTTVMQEIGSDIFAVQEISDDNSLNSLLAGLPRYTKIVSDKWSHSADPPDPNFPPQKIGFVFDTTTVNLIGSRIMFSGLYDNIRAGMVVLPDYPGSSTGFWSSGRLPFMADFRVTLQGISKTVKVIVIHAKSGSYQNDYDRREYDVRVLHDTLMMHHARENIVVLGDFNDEVGESIQEGASTSFHPIVNDTANFKTLTGLLGKGDTGSYLGTGSMLDHVIITDKLEDSFVRNSSFIEDARNYISNYTRTTSDHLPVTARFKLAWSDDVPVIVTGPLDLPLQPLIVHPNPVTDRMAVGGISGESLIGHVVDCMGRSQEIALEKSGENFSCSTAHLTRGVYLLIINNGHRNYCARFLKL